MALLEIRAARREFVTPEGGRMAALDGVDLDVGANEFVTLLGPSGCGKTTLLRAISGFEALDGGTIALDGADLSRLPPFRRPVNTVFQSYALFGHMSVARNVGYALEVARRGQGRSARPRWPRRWKRWVSTAWVRAGPSSCRAASGNGWRWPARSSPKPRLSAVGRAAVGAGPQPAPADAAGAEDVAARGLASPLSSSPTIRKRR